VTPLPDLRGSAILRRGHARQDAPDAQHDDFQQDDTRFQKRHRREEDRSQERCEDRAAQSRWRENG